MQSVPTLFKPGNDEGDLAVKILQASNISHNVFPLNTGHVQEDSYKLGNSSYSPFFANSLTLLRGSDFPAMTVEATDDSPNQVYFSLSEVKTYARRHTLKKLEYEPMDRENLPYFSENKDVVVYDMIGLTELFRGPISQSGFGLERMLALHDFGSWHEVIGENFGPLDYFRAQMPGYLNVPEYTHIDAGTGLVLFGDDLVKIENGTPIVISDDRSHMHVNFKILYGHEGNLMRLSANMVD
ncbi:hypothetical protein HY212_03980 [Candidatus Pacearchaeota archaeon]|nr:hypothetical protein [Candidatus Pacearchaeota archaeon]